MKESKFPEKEERVVVEEVDNGGKPDVPPAKGLVGLSRRFRMAAALALANLEPLFGKRNELPVAEMRDPTREKMDEDPNAPGSHTARVQERPIIEPILQISATRIREFLGPNMRLPRRIPFFLFEEKNQGADVMDGGGPVDAGFQAVLQGTDARVITNPDREVHIMVEYPDQDRDGMLGGNDPCPPDCDVTALPDRTVLGRVK